MTHIEKNTVSGIARYALIITVLASMLFTLACSQSVTMAKQSNKKISIDSLTSVPITMPDIMPVFPDGEDGLMRYISENLIYPSSAVEMKIEGRVTLRFVIDIDGRAKKFEVVRSLDTKCDQAAIQALRGMPKWIPGIKNGVNVPVYYTIPIIFKLNR